MAELKRLRRENEINNPEHRGYYAMFGAQSGDFIINHVVTGGNISSVKHFPQMQRHFGQLV